MAKATQLEGLGLQFLRPQPFGLARHDHGSKWRTVCVQLPSVSASMGSVFTDWPKRVDSVLECALAAFVHASC